MGLKHYVHSNQTGFLKERLLGDNIRRVINLTEEVLHRLKCPTVFYFVDANIAFDRVE